MPERLVLYTIDPVTECVVTEVKLDATDASRVLALLAPEARALVEGGAETDLDPISIARVRAAVGAVEPGGGPVRLRPAQPYDDLPYLVHTGRELAMMLDGRKPLAVFSLWQPLVADRTVHPERVFDPYVDAGRFVKRERTVPSRVETGGRTIPASRNLLYALPAEAWRIDAYLLLMDTADKAGWSEGFERLQGSLLGYDDTQNDIFIERVSRRSWSARR